MRLSPPKHNGHLDLGDMNRFIEVKLTAHVKVSPHINSIEISAHSDVSIDSLAQFRFGLRTALFTGSLYRHLDVSPIALWARSIDYLFEAEERKHGGGGAEYLRYKVCTIQESM